jgi:ankyrin repeat protein
LLALLAFSNVVAAKDMWGKIEVTEGVLGKATILKDTSVFVYSKGKYSVKGKVKKGSEYAVFKVIGSKLKIKNNLYLSKNSTVKYETIAKFEEQALIDAVLLDDITTATKYLKKGIDPNKLNHNKSSLLYFAVDHENSEMVELLLDYGQKPFYDYYDSTPLITSINEKNIEIAKSLLEHDADPNKPSLSKGIPPIFYAIANKDIEMVKILINYKVDKEVMFKGLTPLLSALANNDKDIVKLLLDNGADPNNTKGIALPLFYCILEKNYEMLELLFNYRVSTDVTSNGFTPLEAAILNKDIQISRFLLGKGLNPNSGSKSLPLFLAITNKDLESVNLLIQHKVDIQKKWNNLSPTEYSKSIGATDIYKILEALSSKSLSDLKLVTIPSLLTKEELLRFLNENFRSFKTSLGTTNFTFDIYENTSILSPEDYWIKVDYDMTFFYDLSYSNKITSEMRNTVKQELKDYQEVLGKAVIAAMPSKKFEGGFYKSWYRYPNLRVDLITRHYYTWTNYSATVFDEYQDVKPSNFQWYPLLDDEL